MNKKSAFFIALLAFSPLSSAQDFYVSPQGDDQANGLAVQTEIEGGNGPFRSLLRAQLAIRELKKAGQFNAPVTVHILAGEYLLTKPLEFDLRDSGFAGREIRWQGEPAEQVTISAGMPIVCSKRDAVFWDCPVAKLPASTSYYDTGRIKGNGPKFELFVNDQKFQLARWPDKDWAHIKLPLDDKTHFSVMEPLPELTGNIKDAQVHIFAGNDWYDQYRGVNAVNQADNTLQLSTPTSYNLDSGRRFYIQNLPSLLNAPGEWIYDGATQNINLIPKTGEPPASATLSSLPNAIIADGVGHITFQGFSIQHTTGNAITLKNPSNVVMDNLEIKNIGGKGVEIINGQNTRLSNSKIHHTGGHGVVVYGGERNTLKASGHEVFNNHIHHIGTTILTYSSAIEVNGVGAQVGHNLLEYGNGTAILITGNDHLVEKNEIHHFCLQAGDCGAIYTGREWSWRGNVIRYNYIHDIIGYAMSSVNEDKTQVTYKSPAEARGVFLDDGVAGFEVTGNIFENAGAQAVFISGGRDTKITNNYFNTNTIAISQDGRDLSQNQKTLDNAPYKSAVWQQKYPELNIAIKHKNWPEGNKIQRNIIVTSNPDGDSLVYRVPKESTVISDNIVWSTIGKLSIHYKIFDSIDPTTQTQRPWEHWLAAGIEQHSLMTDPCVTIANNKMLTCANSPIKEIGFEPLPTDIGLIKP